ncbi:transposase [Planosporangium flavigriseum]|uniref:Transposase n=1 Tax=Planosporangium flavigriseum TaxID=373681 RepID=A0A8J3LK87_9ACTN|nr:transposase [Planosporangium flavigriseum]GIG72193.1 hypothetical protein Pfl04_05970 [Planosporangium flavigriseum]
MALVRVYCGLASADLNSTPPGSETWLTVAVVDDAGRLLDICDISDDAPGFAELGSLLAERSNGLESVAIAAASDEHIVTRLLTAAGRYLAFTDEDSAEDYAERFGNPDSADEVQSSPAERRAIGLARALQAGVLSAVAQPTPRDLIAIKPVLSAHAAVTNGRQGAAATLREVLRELYPAALRAFPDPAEAIPLAILDALPEPGPLGTNSHGRGRDTQAIAELAEAGVADSNTLTEAVSALRLAIAETPRRTGMNRSITSAVAETVRQSVAAVRACDAGAAALVSVLAARMPASTGATPAQQPSRSRSRAAGTSAAGTSAAGTSASQPANAKAQTAPAPAAQIAAATTAPAPSAPAAAGPAIPAATSATPAATGAHRAATSEMPTVEPAPRTRAARRAAEKQAEEQSAAQTPTPVQTPPVAPVPVHVPTPPVPLQTPPAPIPVPPPTAVPTPVHPAAQAQPEAPAARPKQTPSVPPPGLTPTYPTGPLRPLAPEPLSTTASKPSTPEFTLAPGKVPSSPLPAEPAASASTRAPGYTGDVGTRPAVDVPPPGSRTNWPLAGEEARESDDAVRTGMPRVDFSRNLDLPSGENQIADLGEREHRIVPPWQSNDLPAEPPALRLVEPAPLADPALSSEPLRYPDEVSAPHVEPAALRMEPPALRLVERNGGLSSALNAAADDRLASSTNGDDLPRRRVEFREPSAEQAEPPAKDPVDGDLLIFAEARSAWFTDHFGEDDTNLEFGNASDEGWRAAKHAAEPAVGAETESGLPRRVPQQNLVPGSPIGAPERPLRVVRDPAQIAAHTSGYFRGWRRGQEVGGYRVGGRPGRESSGGWDFSRDQDGDDERGYEYRSARR